MFIYNKMNQEEFDFIHNRLIDLVKMKWFEPIVEKEYVYLHSNADILVENDEYVLFLGHSYGSNVIGNIIEKQMQEVHYAKSKRKIRKIIKRLFGISSIHRFSRYFSEFPEVQTGGPILQRVAAIYALPEWERQLYFSLANAPTFGEGTMIFSDHRFSLPELIKSCKKYSVEDEMIVIDSKRVQRDYGLTEEEYIDVLAGGFMFYVDLNEEPLKSLFEEGYIYSIQKKID